MDAPVTSAARRAAIRWRPPPTRARRVVTAVLLVLSGLVMLVSFGLAAALALLPAVVGGNALTVVSGSMAPTLRPGSVAVDRPVAPSRLRVGDVVTYTVAAAGATVTDRIVAIGHDRAGLLFTTRGDANDGVDRQPVRANQIRGTLWYSLPYVGFLRTGGVALVGAAFLALLAGGWLLRWSGWPARH